MEKSNHVTRSIFLVNPSFQIKFSVMVALMIVISTMVYPVIIDDFFKIVTANLHHVSKNILSAQRELTLYLVFIQIMVGFWVFIIFIFATHKIAGPMYKLKNHLLSIREGAPFSPLQFRKGDYFHDVSEELNLFLESISQKHENDLNYIDEVASYINNLSLIVPDDKKPVVSEISKKLLEVKSRYKKN